SLSPKYMLLLSTRGLPSNNPHFVGQPTFHQGSIDRSRSVIFLLHVFGADLDYENPPPLGHPTTLTAHAHICPSLLPESATQLKTSPVRRHSSHIFFHFGLEGPPKLRVSPAMYHLPGCASILQSGVAPPTFRSSREHRSQRRKNLYLNQDQAGISLSHTEAYMRD
ncbi:hypothetical protein CLAIMM_14595 isoform 2, partial [Cladophialophora immunda]